VELRGLEPFAPVVFGYQRLDRSEIEHSALRCRCDRALRVPCRSVPSDQGAMKVLRISMSPDVLPVAQHCLAAGHAIPEMVLRPTGSCSACQVAPPVKVERAVGAPDRAVPTA